MNVTPPVGTWRKSSYSCENISDTCVEVARLTFAESGEAPAGCPIAFRAVYSEGTVSPLGRRL
ncbi:DUF397 domain-containing protein [Actinoallomurus sp. NPDC052274]|uniref:DUF397 domain-containing protein n=1 Tax=Actinoallomurus sp. NPDC052274 TaxID=3155420 RepID=UPI00343B7047